MHQLGNVLALPTSLLLVLGTSWTPFTTAAQWPYNLPSHQKYWPEHESLVRRHADIQDRLTRETPKGMRKMSGDPSEMFFLDYWQFEPVEQSDQQHEQAAHHTTSELDLQRRACPVDMPGNASFATSFLPPFLRHSSNPIQASLSLRNIPRSLLQKRDFKCPTDTNACTSIDRPDNCCGKDETCTIIEDTGVGDVGCCPKGEKCGGSVSSCNTAKGYKSCPDSPNGGCCIPDFTCQDVGCVAGGDSSTTTRTSVLTVTGSSSGSSRSSSSTPRTFTDTEVEAASASSSSSRSTNPSVVTVTTTINPSTTTEVVFAAGSSREQGSQSCSTGFQTCAESLGGGCCPTDRRCGTGGACPPRESVTAAAAPVRPTGDSSSSSSSSSSGEMTTSTSMSMCPTGYYMCSAYYIPGCCQVGRDCDTTNCPSSTTETVVSDGATIVVPGGAGGARPTDASTEDVSAQEATSTQESPPSAAAQGQGSCATGWFTCGQDQGGGCCPSGYECGANCQATAGGGSVAKAEPESLAVCLGSEVGVMMVGIASLVGFLMCML